MTTKKKTVKIEAKVRDYLPQKYNSYFPRPRRRKFPWEGTSIIGILMIR